MKSKDIPILMYHDIGPCEHPWSISAELLESHLRYLRSNNIHSITLKELDFLLHVEGELPQDCVVLTFDDARAGVHSYALPLLTKYGFKATLFVVSEWLVAPPPATPPNEQYNQIMSQAQVQTCLNQGWELGSHTRTHRNLTKLEPQEQIAEIISSKQHLESIFQTKVTSFAYPYGAYSPKILNIVKSNYQTATTTHHGLSKAPGEYARQWITSKITPQIFPKLLRKPTLSVVMIVKNEEQFLPHSLSSISGLADELIIADTGSTDSTREIAKHFGAKLVEIPWEHNFSKARNIALSHATTDWIFILDADEVISQADHTIIKDAICNYTVAGFQILTKNYTNHTSQSHFIPTPYDEYAKQFAGYVPSIKTRLFQNYQGYHFEGVVHEIVDNTITRSSGILRPLLINIHHYGEQKNSSLSSLSNSNHTLNESSKLQYHEKLNELKIMEDPTSEKAVFDLAVQQKLLGKYEQAISTLTILYQNNPHNIPVLFELAILETKLSHHQKAQEIYHNIISQRSNSPNLKNVYLSESYAGLGYISLKNQQPEQAATFYEESIKINPLFLDAKINLGAAYTQLSKYSYAIAHLKSALTLHPTNPRALYNLAVVYEKQGNLHLAEEYYQEALTHGNSKAQASIQKIQDYFGSKKSSFPSE